MTYQLCTRCVMDTTDPEIQFDENGVCNHCHFYDRALARYVRTGETGCRELEKLVAQIKREGANKQYDCVIGVSGGVDSTYVAYKVKQLGLRPLAVHLDNGWDSELAVKNIEQTLKILNIDLYTYVINWEEFKDLQLAFLRASTPDAEIPSDHAIVASLYETAKNKDIKVIISGCNKRTELHLPPKWSQGHLDWKYIKTIHNKFGSCKIKTYPHMSFFKYHYYKHSIKWIDILDYLDYSKNQAKALLKKELCWKDYGAKHHESIYTRFYQGYFLPKKFHYDKRKSHLSSLICSKEITRTEALEELKNAPYSNELQKIDLEYFKKKLTLSEDEYERIMNCGIKSYDDYDNYSSLFANPVYKTLLKLYRTIFRS